MSPSAQQVSAQAPSPPHAFLRAKFRDVARMSAPRTKAEHLQSIHDLSFLLVVWARTYRAAWDHEDTPPGVVEYLTDVVDGLALSAEEGELERSREDTLKRLRARAKEAETDTDKTPVKSTKDNKATATSPILASSIHLTFTGPQDASDCHPGLSQSLSGRTLVESPSEILFTNPCGGTPDHSSPDPTPEPTVPATTILIPPPTELETIPEPTSPETGEPAPQFALTSPKPRPASEIPRPPAAHAASASPDLTFAFPTADRPPSHRASTEHLHRSSHEHLHRSSNEHLHPSPSRARRGLAKSFSSTVRSLVSVSSRASEDDHSHSGHSFTSSSATGHSTAASSTDGHADSSATTVSANNSPTPSRKWSGLLGRTDGSVREHPAKLRKRHVSMHARAATAPAGELHTRAVSMGLGEIPHGLSEAPTEGLTEETGLAASAQSGHAASASEPASFLLAQGTDAFPATPPSRTPSLPSSSRDPSLASPMSSPIKPSRIPSPSRPSASPRQSHPGAAGQAFPPSPSRPTLSSGSRQSLSASVASSPKESKDKEHRRRTLSFKAPFRSLSHALKKDKKEKVQEEPEEVQEGKTEEA